MSERPRTRGVVLDLVRAARTISRGELMAGSGLTAASISTIVRELIDDGLLVDVGQGEYTGGKRRRLLRLNAAAGYAVGVQLDRGSSVIVILNLAGEPVSRVSIDEPGLRTPDETLQAIGTHIDELLSESGIDKKLVLGVGLVSHGPQGRASGVLRASRPSPSWQGYPLVKDLCAVLGRPVLLDNDATAAAIGEFWVGGVDPASTYGCIYMAGGIGGGVVVAGEVYRGGTSNAVEIGHITLDPGGRRCHCGNRGCLEGIAGPEAVIADARASADLVRRLGLTEHPGDDVVNFGKVAGAAVGGDPQALRIIENSSRYLGFAAVTLANLFDVDRVLLAGPSFTTAGSIYRRIIQAELDRAGFNRGVHPVTAVLSASGADAAAVGAAVLVLRSELTPQGRRRPDDHRLLAATR